MESFRRLTYRALLRRAHKFDDHKPLRILIAQPWPAPIAEAFDRITQQLAPNCPIKGFEQQQSLTRYVRHLFRKTQSHGVHPASLLLLQLLSEALDTSSMLNYNPRRVDQVETVTDDEFYAALRKEDPALDQALTLVKQGLQIITAAQHTTATASEDKSSRRGPVYTAHAHQATSHPAKGEVGGEGTSRTVAALQAAADTFRSSIAAKPTADAYTYLGWSVLLRGEEEGCGRDERWKDQVNSEVIDLCKKAIEIDPTFGNPYNDIGVCKMSHPDPSVAAECLLWFERAKSAPRYSQRHFPYQNAAVYYLNQKKNLSAALREYLGAAFWAPSEPWFQQMATLLVRCIRDKEPLHHTNKESAPSVRAG
ncbi:unnamed protein product [Vitrella brassicaformis CCMP3155]|uniref:Uncharacterized protein n=2 Tax=Vitrella brassicaformis TaxID=1169539 RepID=A0A0G4FRX6_VITBC|nr:unnamed protein product [Vitrella brassicaformis CCMP3155]|eukprot:CEM17401.1 unnamed protein product [Vitrella brassicaformis CCMP3155]